MKKVFITGVCGQIGSYLCELLLQENYEVYGLKHHDDGIYPAYMSELLQHPKLKIIYGDMTNPNMLNSYVSSYRPTLFINCAAQSNIVLSFDNPEYTAKATGDSVIYCLEAIKNHSPETRFITLGSPLMFGNSSAPQNENSPFSPQSPYAKAKVIGHEAVILYRKSHDIFACNAICFNSESHRRPIDYVSRKITNGAAKIKLGLQNKLVLGNLQSKRDFIHAKDSANAILKIITHYEPDDFVIASGQTHSVQELVELAFSACDLNWKNYVEVDQKYFRDSKENVYCGDVSKISSHLNWNPTYSVNDLIVEMVNYDLILESNQNPIRSTP